MQRIPIAIRSGGIVEYKVSRVDFIILRSKLVIPKLLYSFHDEKKLKKYIGKALKYVSEKTTHPKLKFVDQGELKSEKNPLIYTIISQVVPKPNGKVLHISVKFQFEPEKQYTTYFIEEINEILNLFYSFYKEDLSENNLEEKYRHLFKTEKRTNHLLNIRKEKTQI